MAPVKFSIIIPTCHRNELLAQCLKKLSLAMRNMAPDLFEVIVTDDGKESTAEIMIKKDFPWVRWIKGRGKGPAANRNGAARAAAGKWLLFTDDDCQPDAWWIEEFRRAIESHPFIKVFEGRTYSNRARRSFNEVAPVNEKGGNMPSCNFMISRDVFMAIGGFDENFRFYFEDMDLSYRIKKAGISCLFVPNASVCHPWREVDARSFWENRRFYADSYWQFIAKDEELLRSHSPVFFMKQLIKDILLDTLPNIFQFRGRGILYNLSHRAVHLDLLFRTLFVTQKKIKKIQEKYSLNPAAEG